MWGSGRVEGNESEGRESASRGSGVGGGCEASSGWWGHAEPSHTLPIPQGTLQAA